ncbi:MAG: ribosome-associated translation inhibitor RaiA [Patescibacteria group bacterium]
MPPLIISAKTFKITPTLTDYVTKQMRHAEKFSPVPVQEMKVELDHDKNQRTGLVFRVEMSIVLSKKIIKAGQKGQTMREAIDLCVPKLIRQIEKYKTKRSEKRKPGLESVRTE